MYNEYEIRPIPLSVPHCKRQVEAFLAANGLRLEGVDYYAGVFRLGNDDDILSGGGLSGNLIKCVAVGNELRDEGFSTRLISHLISEAQSHGHHSVKVFTKPSNSTIFESMGFHNIATAKEAVLMENGNGLRNYCCYLRTLHHAGRNGIIIMNANPFTIGHQYLVEKAASKVDRLYIIVVQEDSGTRAQGSFTHGERKQMIIAGTRHLQNVTVVEGSSYQISSATFPTYFLKQTDDATDTHIALDLDIFTRSIAACLNISVRFVGSEPTDLLTQRYNRLMTALLPQHGIEVMEIPRLGIPEPVSASLVRRSLADHSLTEARRMVPETTVPHLIAFLASHALQEELELTPKPGLVDLNDNGAHNDMNCHVMMKSIDALHPYFLKIAAQPADTPDYSEQLRQTGIEAEDAMLNATGGVNTHRGALFALGMAIAGLNTIRQHSAMPSLSSSIASIAKKMPVGGNKSHGAIVRDRYGIGGAMEQAQGGYKDLFERWLPFYRSHKSEPNALHHTLLYIMSTLQDTNIYYRVGSEGAESAKEEIRKVLDNYSEKAMDELNRSFIRQGISPGGSADMLALTIFIDSIT